MIASDGSQMRDGKGHPRSTGTYSQVLGRYVREAGSLTLMPARRLERRVPAMAKKGRVRVGADADIVIFDAGQVMDRSTYREPALPPAGIRHVLVNGVPVVTNGEVVKNVAPGREIRGPRAAPP